MKAKFDEEMRLRNEKIAIIYRKAEKLIWDDRGSGAHMDGSFYTVNDYEFVEGRDRKGNKLDGFRLLGDKACGGPPDTGGWNACGDLLLVKDISEERDFLKKPDGAYALYTTLHPFLSFVTWCRLQIKYAEYKCIGDVVITKPDCNDIDLEKYRCVKMSYWADRYYSQAWWKNQADVLGHAKLYRYVRIRRNKNLHISD